MPDFYFQIRSATQCAPSGEPVRLPDAATARNEAAAMFADFARDIAADLAGNPAWQLEVLDGDGRAVFRIKLVAETL
jgi:hypothetical protein